MTREVAILDGFRGPVRGLVELEADEMVGGPSEGSAWRQLREQRFRARRIALALRQSGTEARREFFPGHQRVRLLSRRAGLATVPSSA